MPGLPPEPNATYSSYKEPTVKTWTGHFMDTYNGEVDLNISHKNGDTVTVVLVDKGHPGSTSLRGIELPTEPLTINQDIDLSNFAGNNKLVETFIVKNIAELADGVTLSLLQKQLAQSEGPLVKIQYSRPARIPGTHRTLELVPYEAPPR